MQMKVYGECVGDGGRLNLDFDGSINHRGSVRVDIWSEVVTP